jgi:general secretion pathway protein C
MGFKESAGIIFKNIEPTLKRLPISVLVPWIISLYIGYTLSDLVVLYSRSYFLPEKAPEAAPARRDFRKLIALEDYNIITQRNIFNEDGVIPPALGASEEGLPQTQAAVPSQLPITLLGTIVHFNPNRSIATVQITSKGVTQSYMVDEDIEGLARVTKVERKRLTFVNTSTRRLEYIEITEEDAFNFDLQAGMLPSSTGPVEQTGRFDFKVKKSELDRLTSNLSQVLQQARMEPRYRPDGAIDGFCFVNIQQGSAYESFGFKVGDCIKSVNGEIIDSPQKAMETYNRLRSAGNVQLGVERDGRDENRNYTIE